MSRFVPLFLFGLLVAILAIGLIVDTKEVRSAYLDKPIPQFRLTDLIDSSKQVSNQDLTNRVAILNVWASWCSTCYLEHPVLLELSKNKKILLLGLNYKDSRINALNWIKKEGNPYHRIAYDGRGDAGIDLGVTGVPETFVIDPKGNIRFKHSGALTHKLVAEKILPLIQKLEKIK